MKAKKFVKLVEEILHGNMLAAEICPDKKTLTLLKDTVERLQTLKEILKENSDQPARKKTPLADEHREYVEEPLYACMTSAVKRLSIPEGYEVQPFLYANGKFAPFWHVRLTHKPHRSHRYEHVGQIQFDENQQNHYCLVLPLAMKDFLQESLDSMLQKFQASKYKA